MKKVISGQKANAENEQGRSNQHQYSSELIAASAMILAFISGIIILVVKYI